MIVADIAPASQGRFGSFDYVTLPLAGIYRIDAWGARGGDVLSYSGRGGFGAHMSGYFDLEEGTELKILVGKQATWTSGTRTGGGGGGTFICLASDDTPMVVAGGGGGALDNNDGQNARTSHNGTGSGGNAACGAGFAGNGLSDNWVSPGALSYINGGAGSGPGNYGQEGGFGGGGCTHGYYGTQYPGGGGYTGGSSGQSMGAGSYNTGFDQQNLVGDRTGSGRALIELVEEFDDVDGIWRGIARLRGYADAFVQLPFFRVKTFSHLPYNDLKLAFAALQRRQIQNSRDFGPQTGFYDGPW